MTLPDRLKSSLAAALMQNSPLAAVPVEDLREAAVALDALAKILDGFDAGVFVRDISQDHKSGWAIRAFPYLAALGKAAKLMESVAEEAKR